MCDQYLKQKLKVKENEADFRKEVKINILPKYSLERTSATCRSGL